MCLQSAVVDSNLRVVYVGGLWSMERLRHGYKAIALMTLHTPTTHTDKAVALVRKRAVSVERVLIYTSIFRQIHLRIGLIRNAYSEPFLHNSLSHNSQSFCII